MNQEFDAIVIGAGQAGPSLAARLSREGWSVAMVERKLFGGTCVNTGCTPTKTLVANAEAIQKARSGELYGFNAFEPQVDFARVMARKDAVVNASRSGLEKWLGGLARCTIFRGAARFESATAVRVGDALLRAPHVFVNVGGRPLRPAWGGVDTVPYLTSTTILELTEVPRHLVVVGGSYVGLEFAQMFRRFGAEVTVIERSKRLLPHEDEDVATCIQSILEEDGIHLRLGAECIELYGVAGAVSVSMTCDDGDPRVEGSHILLAVGRVPNTDDLGAEAAGLKLDERGFIEVDDTLQTSVAGVWAMGDCNGRGAFTHTAYNDYEIVAANLFDHAARGVSQRIQAHALYVDPPLAQVGMTETEVRQSGQKALVGRRPMTKVSRAVEKGETRGFIKVLVGEESGMILGASIIGPGADEAIHCILTCMYAGQPASLLTRSVHIHPTLAELIPTTLEDLKPLEV